MNRTSAEDAGKDKFETSRLPAPAIVHLADVTRKPHHISLDEVRDSTYAGVIIQSRIAHADRQGIFQDFQSQSRVIQRISRHQNKRPLHLEIGDFEIPGATRRWGVGVCGPGSDRVHRDSGLSGRCGLPALDRGHGTVPHRASTEVGAGYHPLSSSRNTIPVLIPGNRSPTVGNPSSECYIWKRSSLRWRKRIPTMSCSRFSRP